MKTWKQGVIGRVGESKLSAAERRTDGADVAWSDWLPETAKNHHGP